MIKIQEKAKIKVIINILISIGRPILRGFIRIKEYSSLIVIYGILLLILIVGIDIYKNIFRQFPNINQIYFPPKMSTVITDRKGEILYKFYEGENRIWIPIEKIPENIIKATIAIEDKEFYTHKGVSIRGIIRSIFYNLKHKESLRGGSTITQQLVKNVFLGSEKTWNRKMRELVLSIMIERKLSKNEILERYFNQVNYGGETYGISEAAYKYFGKKVWELDQAEAAFLAGLPAAPSFYNDIEIAKQRQIEVINQMVVANYLTTENAEKIKKEKIEIKKNKVEIKAPHFVFFVRDLVKEKFGFSNIERQGLIITTSLDKNIQEMAEKITKEEVLKLKKLNITNGAALVIDVKTGDILAMVGSVNGDYNVTTALRQPGSAIKPINYLLALKRGWTMNSIIDDSPVTYYTQNQKPYTPKDYTGKFMGKVTLKTALASSLNIPSVKLLNENGVENMINMGRLMGINTWEDKNRFGLSLALGSGEVKMTELAGAYSIFANLGEKIEINPLLKIINYLNENVYQKEIFKEQIIEQEYAYIINSMLTDDEARAPVFGRNSLLNIKEKTVAVKTGTTNNMRDNWCIGWTPSYLVVVWVGNNDNSPMSYVASGVTGATPIWNKIMKELIDTRENENWIVPEQVKKIKVCGKEGYYINGTEKNIQCPTISQ